jgi:hypothetical protein
MCTKKNTAGRAKSKKNAEMFAREQKERSRENTAMSSSLLVYFLHSCRNLFIILNIVIFSHHTSSTNQNRPSITFLSQRFTVDNPDAHRRYGFPVFARHWSIPGFQISPRTEPEPENLSGKKPNRTGNFDPIWIPGQSI